MCEGIGPRFAGVEEALGQVLFPALLGEPGTEPTLQHQRLRRIGAKEGGVGIRDPTATAERCHTASVECTSLLVKSLLGEARWSLYDHAVCSSRGRLAGARRAQGRGGH